MRRSFPLLLRFLLFIFLPLACALLWLFIHFRSSLPPQSGEVRIQGISTSVHIVRDAQGVPVIKADSDRDVFFATGYVHAQDRLWQLEVQRRVVRGRLSEVFGKETVRQDAWMRTLGLYEAAKHDWPALSPEARASLSAYAEGINAWMAAHTDLPIEFATNAIRPEPWTVYDSLAWIKLFALNLGGNMRGELAHYVALPMLSQDKIASIFNIDATAVAMAGNYAPKTAQAMQQMLLGQEELEHTLKIGGRYVGSNAWVVSGKLTSTGNALLANDPHLGLQIPSLWYPLVQQGQHLASSGMSMVGLPLVVFGRNRDIAWGGTSLMADVQDLYLEEVNPLAPTQYRANGQWKEFATHTETIRVKADFPSVLSRPFEPVTLQVRSTRHGPVVSDFIGPLDQPVSLQWTALQPGDVTYDSFFHLNYATDWASFRTALRNHVAPALNVLFADNKGNIGYVGAGRIPVRAKGSGFLPVSGATDEYSWTGYIPFDGLPQIYNPQQGYIVSANNKPIGSDYPYFLSNEWAPDGRARRIEQLLNAHIKHGEKLTPDMFGVMQGDIVSLPARQATEILTGMKPTTGRQEKALGYLRSWGGEMTTATPSPAIFNVWMRHLRTELFKPSLKASWNDGRKQDVLDGIASGVDLQVINAALSDGRNIWCDQGNPRASSSCERRMRQALDEALDELEKLDGFNMGGWRWQDIHQTVYEHAPFSHSKVLALLFEKRIANGGSTDTINVANATYQESEGYRQTFGASFRQIIPLNDKASPILYMNSTGQSGNIFSPHYADMVEPFRDVQYRTLPDASAVDGKTASFKLVPAN
jgi:penicillin amidase